MSVILRSLFVLALLGSFVSTASAVPNFLKQFAGLYLNDSNAEYGTAVKEAKCYLCHQGKNKKNHNAYGEALEHEGLTKADKNDVEKILAALEAVAALSSDPETEGAPTYGELIAQGELPGGSLEDSMKEPEESEEE